MSDLVIFLFGAGVTVIVGTAISSLILVKNRAYDSGRIRSAGSADSERLEVAARPSAGRG